MDEAGGIWRAVAFCASGGVVGDYANGPVDDNKGEGANDYADKRVEYSVSSLFGFAWVASRSHVVETTDDDEDDGYDTGY